MNFLLFVIGVIGMTHIIVDSSIFKPVRELALKYLPRFISKVFECYQCMGFWCGCMLGLTILSHNPFVVFAAGCGGSFLSNLAAAILNYLDARAIVDIGVHNAS